VKIINIAGGQMQATSTGNDLSQKIFELVAEIGELPNEIVVELQFGEGGDDSKIFVDELLGMYAQYAKLNNNSSNDSTNTHQSSRQKPRTMDEYYDSSYSDNRVDSYESYSVPLPRPNTSSNLPDDPKLTNKVPTSLSSRAQSLNVLRQSLASGVENAQSLGRSYTDSKTTNSSTSLADIYNSQFDTTNNNNNKQDSRKKFNGVTPSPFATESTVKELSSFDELDRNLTKLMTEKTSLDDELEKYLLYTIFLL
jgi:hypothetical protein